MVDVPYEYGGVTDTWIVPGTVGGETGPAYYTFDVRAKYTRELPVGKPEFFLDLFNIFDKQSAITEQDLIAGDGGYAFGQATIGRASCRERVCQYASIPMVAESL